MTAPGPIAGSNPYTGAYQTEQYDTTVPPAKSPLRALDDKPGVLPAPGSAVDGDVSPDKVFAARDYQNSHPGWTGIP